MDRESLTAATDLVDDLQVNSARMVDILLETEEKFGIAIDDQSADRLRTIGDAVELILEKQARAAAGRKQRRANDTRPGSGSVCVLGQPSLAPLQVTP